MARARRRTGVAGEELEAAFAVKVENLLTLYGWRWYHTHDSRRSPAGFPDYVAVRGHELLFVELKAERGRTRPAQEEWLRELGTFARLVAVAAAHAEREGLATDWRLGNGELAGLDHFADERGRTVAGAVPADAHATGRYPRVDVYLWRPSDLDAINDRLSRGRHRLEYAG